jgi:hypothetical protein
MERIKFSANQKDLINFINNHEFNRKKSYESKKKFDITPYLSFSKLLEFRSFKKD